MPTTFDQWPAGEGPTFICKWGRGVFSKITVEEDNAWSVQGNTVTSVELTLNIRELWNADAQFYIVFDNEAGDAYPVQRVRKQTFTCPGARGAQLLINKLPVVSDQPGVVGEDNPFEGYSYAGNWVSNRTYVVKEYVYFQSGYWFPRTPPSTNQQPGANIDVDGEDLYWKRIGKRAPSVMTYEFPYEDGRTVTLSFGPPTYAVGVGGPFIRRIGYGGSIPTVHYFADPVDHSEIGGKASTTNGEGFQQFGLIELAGGDVYDRQGVGRDYRVSGQIPLPVDFGFGIGGFQRNTTPWGDMTVVLTVSIYIANPADYFRENPTEYLVPRGSGGGIGSISIPFEEIRKVSFFGSAYKNYAIDNQQSTDIPGKRVDSLTGDVGGKRGLFYGRKKGR